MAANKGKPRLVVIGGGHAGVALVQALADEFETKLVEQYGLSLPAHRFALGDSVVFRIHFACTTAPASHQLRAFAGKGFTKQTGRQYVLP